MQDDSAAQTGVTGETASELYVVRLGEGEGAQYAICVGIDMQAGSYQLAGSNQTLADLVTAQQLRAARIESKGIVGPVSEFVFEPQSGFTSRLIYKKV